MGDDYTSIPILGIPWLTEVWLYEETLDHIATQHAEFAMQLPLQRSGLEDAIANPTTIHASTTDPERSVVIVSSSFTHNGDPVVVPVKRMEETSGRVKTAYFSSDQQSGRILWSSGNE